MRLTDLSVQSLKPPEKGQRTFFDDSLKGFGCRVSIGGAKSWVVMTGRERRLITLARYPEMSLREARKAAMTAIAEPPKPKRDTTLLKEAVELFVETSRAKHRKKTTHGYELIVRFLLKRLKNIPLGEITTDSVMDIVEGLEKTPTQQRHVFVVAVTFFRFCIRRRLLTANPLEGMQSPSGIKTRERVLTEAEIRTVWQAASVHPYPFALLIKLCLLTGQRRGELNKLQWENIDFEKKTITIPSHIAKNGKEHVFPIEDMSIEVLKALPNHSAYLFPGRLKGTFEGFSRAKQLFDKTCPIAHFQLHDLRRSFATYMASLGVEQIVLSKMLNHVAGTLSPISAIYNRYSYFAEQKTAVLLWERKLASIVTP